MVIMNMLFNVIFNPKANNSIHNGLMFADYFFLKFYSVPVKCTNIPIIYIEMNLILWLPVSKTFMSSLSPLEVPHFDQTERLSSSYQSGSASLHI